MNNSLTDNKTVASADVDLNDLNMNIYRASALIETLDELLSPMTEDADPGVEVWHDIKRRRNMIAVLLLEAQAVIDEMGCKVESGLEARAAKEATA